MRLEPPAWWYGTRPADRLKAALLWPAGCLYGAAARARFAFARPYRSSLPVICIGNFTLGGAGKTPLAIEIARMVRDWGGKPAFLTRGYGGSIAGPHRVDVAADTAAQVGDEALLLARAAPTFVAYDRKAGAQAIEAAGARCLSDRVKQTSGADVIIMDDGFQNPSLAKDLTIVAVDAGAGLGNGWVFPAGPLRSPLGAQRRRADAIVLIGEVNGGCADLRDGEVPVWSARIQPSGDTAWLAQGPIIAFCGIGRPAKFFDTLTELGARVIATRAFPDHHVFAAEEAASLLDQAARAGAALVTTEKDWVRFDASEGALSELKAKTRALPIMAAIAPDDMPQLNALLIKAMGR
jgi:tetraacyldisaccharide 4'-kinase